MALPDMLMQVVNFLIVLVTILFIITLVLAVVPDESPVGMAELFDNACAEEDGSGMLQGLSYDKQSSLVQFMLPRRLTGGVNMRMTYPRNTFRIIESYLNDVDCDLKTAADSMAGLYLERKNYRFFETCVGKQCFCAAKTGMSYLTYEDSEYTACFPRLYAFAKGTFNSIVDGKTCINDQDLFEDSIMETLQVLKQNIDCETDCNQNFDVLEAQKIFDCYNLFLDLQSIGGEPAKYDYEYKGTSKDGKGLYTLTLNNPANNLTTASGEELETAITDFYDLTKAGLLSEVLFCTEIPDTGNCYCPYSGNYMISKESLQGVGLFLGVAGSKGDKINTLNIGSILVTSQSGATSCTFDTRTIS